MGETGPCGPCSEIHIDRGPAACDRQGDAGHRCARERRLRAASSRSGTWSSSSTTATPPARCADLPAKHVDTGMGFERIAAVLQGVPSATTTPTSSARIIAGAERLAGKRYGADRARRRLAPRHRRPRARGHLPDRRRRPAVERGPRLRAAPRSCAAPRATASCSASTSRSSAQVVRRGRRDDGRAPIPRSSSGTRASREVVRGEEERFAETLDRGLALLDGRGRARARAPARPTLPGDVAFQLYDTYGFPLDLTEDILRGRGHGGRPRRLRRARWRRSASAARGAQRFADAAAAPERRGAERRLALRRRPHRRVGVDGAGAAGRRRRRRARGRAHGRRRSTSSRPRRPSTPSRADRSATAADRDRAAARWSRSLDTQKPRADRHRAPRHGACAARSRRRPRAAARSTRSAARRRA